VTNITITSVISALSIGASFGSFAVSAKPITYDLPAETATFRPYPDVEFVEKNCTACHSADYVSTQPPKRGKAFWQAEVTKMIKVFGAPIEEGDVNKIVEYLTGAY
jgi:sulfite dehydrogenase (cytochrome) subunit B